MRNAIGVYSKRDEGSDELPYEGAVYRCACGKGWFYPNDDRLNAVEIEHLPMPE